MRGLARFCVTCAPTRTGSGMHANSTSARRGSHAGNITRQTGEAGARQPARTQRQVSSAITADARRR